MAVNCPGLVVLDLELMAQVTDAGIQDLCHGLSSLASLNVGGTQVRLSHAHTHTHTRTHTYTYTHAHTHLTPQVSNVGFQIIGGRLGGSLRHISAAGCVQLTDLGVSDLCKCESLVEISLRSCPRITDQVSRASFFSQPWHCIYCMHTHTHKPTWYRRVRRSSG